MWNLDAQQNSKGASKEYVREGNIDVYVFSTNKTRVRFLTEKVDIEKIMSEQKITRELAEEYVKTDLIYQKWIMPISTWEHIIPSIQGERFFSTVACPGKNSCEVLCAENEAARERGVDENRLLPYPVRKRFLVPAYFYELNRILFVKNNQDFFDDIAYYINDNDGPLDFEIYKTGKGFNTKYKAKFAGKSIDVEIPKLTIMPKDLELTETKEAIMKKIALKTPKASKGFTKSNSVDTTSKVEQDNDDPGSYVFTFRGYKGKTIEEVYKINPSYIDFIVENSSGMVKKKAEDFLNGLQ